MLGSRRVLLLAGVLWCLAGCAASKSSDGAHAGPLTTTAVAAAFGSVGIRLLPFPSPPGAKQLVSYDPAVDVEILPSVAEAKAVSRPQVVNGKEVDAIGTRNVLVWIDKRAPAAFHRRVYAALTALSREP